MKKTGFTLVELLAVIIILALIVTVTITNMIGIFDTSKEKSYELFISDLKNATDEYVKRYPIVLNTLDADHPVYTIHLSDLISEYLVKEPVINPKTNDALDPTNTSIEIRLNSDTDINNGAPIYEVIIGI